MARPVVVVVTGPPCSGKTTIGRGIADRFRLPFVGKDMLKETLYDTLGCGDVDWSLRLSGAAMSLLFVVADSLLRAGSSMVLEGNFRPDLARVDLGGLAARHAPEVCQVFCTANSDILIERNRRRWLSGERHRGHIDDQTADRVSQSIRAGVYAQLDLPGALVTCDTSDLANLDTEPIYSAINAALARARRESESS